MAEAVEVKVRILFSRENLTKEQLERYPLFIKDEEYGELAALEFFLPGDVAWESLRRLEVDQI